MAYQSLYRRYRSQRFSEVLGQDHVTKALQNSVREGRVGHGYLFTGPRGTGKTSTARILAKVLNCEHPEDGEPDTTCENCRAVEEGRSVDWLHELDAASNNGVDAMRDLLGRVSMGTSGNRKVYILDEVHMLSKGAANTLLKTLEEPPAHVVFVLATTEPEKVLPTIQSRTQRFDFRLLSAEVLANHVRHVIEDAGLGLGEDAVDYVVRAGGGSARDTLSALDQVAAAGGVEEISTPISDLVEALGAQDAGAALVAVDTIVRSGQHPRTLAEALIGSLREAFLVAMGAPADGLSELAAADARATAASLGPATLTASMEAIGSALVEMRQAPDPRIPLEVALVRLTSPIASNDLSALEARLERLEATLASGPTTATPEAPAQAAAPAPPEGAGAQAASGAAEARSEPSTRSTRADQAAGKARGVEAARARLSRGPTGDEPGPSAPPPAASRPSLGGVRRSQSGYDEEPEDAAATTPQPGSAAAPPAPSGGATAEEPATGPAETPSGGSAAINLDDLRHEWSTVLGGLRGRAKALYKPGEFVELEGKVAKLAFPNEAHCSQAEDKRAEVEAALESQLGRSVVLNLVVASGGGLAQSSHSPAVGGGAPGGAGPDNPRDAGTDPGVEAESIDLDELTDAPDAGSGGIAQLKDAFPGAELMEE